MYNKIVLAGNIVRPIEIKYTQSGSAIANTAIATSRKFKSQTGEQKEETLFVDITFFGRTAEVANQYLRKGSKVLVDGRLKLDQWTAQDGSKRSKHSVTVESLQMLGSKDDAQSAPVPTPAPTQNNNDHNNYGGDNGYGGNNTYSAPPAQASAPSNTPEIDGADEIPF